MVGSVPAPGHRKAAEGGKLGGGAGGSCGGGHIETSFPSWPPHTHARGAGPARAGFGANDHGFRAGDEGSVRQTRLEPGRGAATLQGMTRRSPFRYFRSSPEVIRLAVMMYVRFPLSLRNVEDLLRERGIGVSDETVRLWWQRFGPMFATELRRKRVSGMRALRWRWHRGEVFARVNGSERKIGSSPGAARTTAPRTPTPRSDGASEPCSGMDGRTCAERPLAVDRRRDQLRAGRQRAGSYVGV